MPYLFRVSNGQTFAPVAITILFDQITHEPDGFPSGRTTLQGNLFQLFDHEHTLFIDQFLPTRDGGLANAQLLFIQTGIGRVDELVGSACFRNGTLQHHASRPFVIFGVHTSRIDSQCRVVIIRSSRHDVYPGAVVAVARMAGDDGTIGRGLLADHDTGTTLRIQHRKRLLCEDGHT